MIDAPLMNIFASCVNIADTPTHTSLPAEPPHSHPSSIIFTGYVGRSHVNSSNNNGLGMTWELIAAFAGLRF